MTQGLSTGPNRGKDMPWSRETLMRREREAGILLDPTQETVQQDRKSTRLNSSHSQISYAVFCLQKNDRQKDRTAHSPHRTPSDARSDDAADGKQHPVRPVSSAICELCCDIDPSPGAIDDGIYRR